LKIVRHLAGTTFAEVVRAFAVHSLMSVRGSKQDNTALTWRTRISIRNSHLRQCQPVEDWSSIITYVTKYHAFSQVKVEPERPLLPFNDLAVDDPEGYTFGLAGSSVYIANTKAPSSHLRDDYGLEVFSKLDKLWGVLAIRILLPDRFVVHTVQRCSGRHTVDSDNCHGDAIYRSRYFVSVARPGDIPKSRGCA
jgi:hypothetical protein